MSIDWKQQWKLFAKDFHNGKAHLDLKPYGGSQELLLEPGEGFGDLSHPTTLLVLELMHPFLKDQSVIDIGTGSGVLAIAALLMNASFAYGIDLNASVLKHVARNALLNRVEKQLHLFLPKQAQEYSFPKATVLMNMIFSEQEAAWKQYSSIHHCAKTVITSGILLCEREKYLRYAAKLKWELLIEKEKEGWMGFVFESKN